jgi:hypothetical protein
VRQPKGLEVEEPRRTNPVIIVLATLFLIIAWAWDLLTALGRWLFALVPWLALRKRAIAIINKLPIFIVVIIYGVPFLIVEPLKAVLLWLMATGHFLFGLVSLIILQTFGLSLLALVFDLTRERLLTLKWFAWCYDKALLFHHYADELLAPYKEAAKQKLRAARRWAHDWLIGIGLAKRRPEPKGPIEDARL